MLVLKVVSVLVLKAVIVIVLVSFEVFLLIADVDNVFLAVSNCVV